MPTFEYETRLNCSVEGLFDFLSRPANIARLSSPDLGLTFTSAPEVISAGTQLEFQIVTFGQVVTSKHDITVYDRPHLVVEKQVSGLMKSWIYRHLYEATAEGVLKRDIVEYEQPGGILGMLLTDAKIADYLEGGCYDREQRLLALVASGELK